MLFAHMYNRFPYPMSPDDNAGGGGNSQDNGGNPSAPGGHLDPERLKAKHGDAEAALRALAFKLDDVERDNAKQRQEIGELKAQLPGEGSVVLSGDQTAVWQAYQALGKPDELQTALGNFAKLQRDEIFRAAAEAHQLKASVLSNLKGIDDYQIEVREQEQDGKKVKVAIAKNKEGQERPLTDLINEKWADFKPALVDKPTTPSGTPWPKQSLGLQGADLSTTDQYLERQRKVRTAAKNPITGD